MFRFHLSVVVIFIFNFLFCSNEEFNISTSRPGSFNPTSTIAIDKYQIELGINNNSNDDYLWIFGRKAVFENHEFQLTTSNGYIAFGYMYGNIEINKRSESSIITTFNYDIKSKKIDNISFCFPFMYTLDKNLSLNSHININIDPDYDIDQIQYSYAFAVNKSIFDNLVFFSEVYGNSGSIDNANESYFDLGLVYTTKSNLQFDVSAGASVNDNFNIEDYYFIELGFSFYL